MANKRHKPEEIVQKLRQVDVLVGQGMARVDAIREVRITEQTYYRWRKQYGGMGTDQLKELKRLSKTSPRVNIVRAFEDGDYVFAHTEYDFAKSNIGFEIFRFEGDRVVEHWDTIQQRQGPNPSGHSMVDGPTEAADLALTDTTRQVVRAFGESVLVHHRLDELEHFIEEGRFTQHNRHMADGISALRAALEVSLPN